MINVIAFRTKHWWSIEANISAGMYIHHMDRCEQCQDENKQPCAAGIALLDKWWSAVIRDAKRANVQEWAQSGNRPRLLGS